MRETPPLTESELVELVRSSDACAPDALHRQVQALVARHGEPARRRRRSPRVEIAAALALAVVVVAVALATGLGRAGSTTLSMRQTVAPMLRAATMPAPPRSSANPARLAAAVDGVRFPYWADRFGWRSTGMRDDRMDGRAVTTVFYSDSRGRRIGYAIVAGTPAPRVDGDGGGGGGGGGDSSGGGSGDGVALWRGGVPYRMLSTHGVAVVTWLRDGHLCIVSGRGVSGATLLKLASWTDRDATAS